MTACPPAEKKPARGGWNSSTRFRIQYKQLAKQIAQQEILWRARIEATVRHYSLEELEKFAVERGVTVSNSARALHSSPA